jgi:hypothetical protein
VLIAISLHLFLNFIAAKGAGFFEKLTVAQRAKKFFFFLQLEGLLMCSQCMLLVPILSQVNPIHNLTQYFF